MPRKNSNRRSKFVVNYRLQITYLLQLVTAVTVSCGVFFLGLRFFYKKVVSSAEVLGFGTETPVGQVIDLHYNAIVQVLGFSYVSILLVFLIVGLITSNRFAGPVYRLIKYFNEFPEHKGKVKFGLRKGDYFQELVKSVNRFVENK